MISDLVSLLRCYFRIIWNSSEAFNDLFANYIAAALYNYAWSFIYCFICHGYMTYRTCDYTIGDSVAVLISYIIWKKTLNFIKKLA